MRINWFYHALEGVIISLAAFLLLSPVKLQAWGMEGAKIVKNAIPLQASVDVMPTNVDLNGDGRREDLTLTSGGTAQIYSGSQIVWQSPADWQVKQVGTADLNQDGRPEAILLVWRDFHPWPVDSFLPVGGRISAFHNVSNQSCHIILIGWKKDRYAEMWAGSALAEPIRSFWVGDINKDGKQELITLESAYDDPPQSPARAIKIWEWNGFGFRVLDQINGPIQNAILVRPNLGPPVLLIQ